MRMACVPGMKSLPRNFRTAKCRSVRQPVWLSPISIRPSTIVCSGDAGLPRPLVSRNIVQSQAPASICSSCTNFFRASTVLRVRLGGQQPVHHQHAGLKAHDLPPQQGQQARQPVALEQLEGAEIGEVAGDRRRIVERKLGQVGQHALMLLGQQRDVDGPAAGGDAGVAELVAEDRLACPRRALDDVEPVPHEAAEQQCVPRRQRRSAGAAAAVEEGGVKAGWRSGLRSCRGSWRGFGRGSRRRCKRGQRQGEGGTRLRHAGHGDRAAQAFGEARHDP